MSAVLACDLGGTSLRVALIDRAGRTVARRGVASRTGRSDRDGAELDPASWWDDLGAAVEALAVLAPDAFASVEAVAISAITRSQVFLGAGGEVLRPAMLWQDIRAETIVEGLKASCPQRHPEAAELNAFHPLARLCWLARAEPDNAAALAYVVDPKDYLNFRLTGVIASDAVSIARLVAAARPGPDGRSLMDAAGIDARVVPRLVDPTSVVGRVRAGLDGALGRLAGVPVVAMANDTWASVVGLGAMRPGFAYNLSGTTEVFGIVGDHAAAADGLLSVDWGEGVHQLGGPSQNGADVLAWLASIGAAGERAADDVAILPADRLAAVLAEPRDPERVLFLPYLRGERVPWWDPSLRGAFVGLNRRHRLVDLVWSVMEGVALHNRVVLERAEAGTRIRVSEIRFGGGGATNPAWCQVKADVLGRPVVVTDQHEHGLLGAAIVAWTALGRYPSLAAAQEALVATARRFEPSPERGAAYERLYALFLQAHTLLRPISHALAAADGGL